MMQKVKIILLIALLSMGMSCANTTGPNVSNGYNAQDSPVPPLPTATIDEIASGKKAFETNCVVCHKADGTGGKVTVEDKSLNVENLRSAKIKAFSNEKIIGYIMKGVPDEGMPAFKDKLSEGEMRDIVLFIRKEFHNQ